MEKTSLHAEPRQDSGRHGLRTLRAASQVPAVVYGPGFEARNVAVDRRELHQALRSAGSGLIELRIGDGGPIQVLAREVQRHPVKRRALHVDFMAVSMTEKMRLQVPIVIEGTAPILSRPDLVMVRNMDSLEIECLPSDIPNHLAADVSGLKAETDSVYVRDLILPAGVRAMGDPNHPVVSLPLIRAIVEEETAEAAETPVAAAEPEVVTKGKKEEAE